MIRNHMDASTRAGKPKRGVTPQREIELVDWLPPLLAAPFIGSFIGVLIARLPANRPVAMARSACDQCHHPLGWADLVPLASFAVLRGRCRYCRAPIAWFHPAVEIAALAVAAWAASAAPTTALLWADCGFGWTLLTLAWIDAGHLILPDVLTLPLIVAGLSVTWWLTPALLASHALGAIAGYCGFRLISIVYRLLRGRDGMGEGDAKLLAAAGAWVGIAALPRLILGAAMLGIAFTMISLWRDRATGLEAAVAFGPALALAAFAVRLYAHG